MNDVPRWDGQFLGEQLAIAFFSDSATKFLIGFAKSDMASAMIYPEQFGQFLLTHVPAEVICYDAAQVHWDLYDLLLRRNDKNGLRALWRLSRRSRLHDIMLLEQRLRLIQHAVHPLPKRFGALTDLYCKQTSPAAIEPGPCGAPPQRGRLPEPGELLARAATTMDIYQTLRQRADQVINRLGIPQKLVARYGPLGLGIDVQGAIAAQLTDRIGLCINEAAVRHIEKAVDADCRHASETLHNDDHARYAFAWNGRMVRQRDDGTLAVDQERLRKWLRKSFDDFRDLQDGLLFMPFADGENDISTDPRHWGVVVRYSPSLYAWSNLVAAAGAKQWLHSIGKRSVHPAYQLVPEIRSLTPDLLYLRSKGALFCPPPGRQYLVVRLCQLELRCFAFLCKQHYRRSDASLARMFQEGKDPIQHAAAEFYARDTAKKGKPVEVAFESIRAHQPAVYDRWVEIARVLLFAVPRSIAAPQLRQFLRHDVDLSFGEVDAQELLRWLSWEIYPELEVIEEDSTLPTLAKHFGVKERRLFSAFNDDTSPETRGLRMRKVLMGNSQDKWATRILQSLVHREKAREIIREAQGESAYKLLEKWPVSPSGLVGRKAYCTHSRSMEHALLADELRKQVAYVLAANDYRLAAIADDEFLLETPAGQDTAEVEHLVVSTGKGVLGDVANRCCACQVMDAW